MSRSLGRLLGGKDGSRGRHIQRDVDGTTVSAVPKKLSTHDDEEYGQRGVLGLIGIFVSAHHANHESKVSEAPGLGTVSEIATVEVTERVIFRELPITVARLNFFIDRCMYAPRADPKQ